MPWFKVDDDLARHPKILSISRRDRAAAMGLWCLAGAWSAANLTDGLVPDYLPHELGCSKRLADVLVGAGLWEPEGRAWRFHDWAERQPSRDQTLARRQADKERQQRHRQEREQKRRSEQQSGTLSRRDTAGTNGTVTPAPTRPDPTRTRPQVQEPSAAEAANAGALVKEFIDRSARKPTGQTIGRIGKELKRALDEGHDYTLVRAALAQWAQRAPSQPSQFNSFLEEQLNPPTAPRFIKTAQSTPASRAQDFLDLIKADTPKAIGGQQ